MPTSFSIQTAVLEAMQQFCLKPTSTLGHLILHDILVEIAPDAVRLVATDGYCLGMLHLTGISGFGFRLHTCDTPTAVVLPLEEVKPLLRDRKQSVLFTVEEATVTLHAGGTCLTVSQRPGEDYPDYRRVLPETDDTSISRIALDTALLGRFANFAKILKEEPFFDFAFTHPTGPIGVRLKSVSSFYGVLMPRVLAFEEGMPAWLRYAGEAELPAMPETAVRIIRMHDLDGIDTFTGTDDDGCVWTQFVVDTFAEQLPGTCAICGAELQNGWLNLDNGGEEVCDSHIEITEVADESYVPDENPLAIPA